MSTLILENIKHPDASGNALELSADGSITVGNKFTGNVGINSTATANLDVRTDLSSGKIAEFHQNAGYGVDIGSSQSDAYISSGYLQSLQFKTDPSSGQVARMIIDPAGYVTTPAQPAFNAYSPAGGTASGSDIVYGSTRFNNGGHYNTSTGKFTAPISGYYHFSFSVLVNTTGPGYTRVYFNVNGSYGSEWGDTLEKVVTDWGSSCNAATIYLNAGDYLSIRNDGNNTYGPQYGHFSGHLIG